MKAEVQEVIDDIEKSLKLLSEKKNISESRTRLEEIESITSKADFWSNLNNAKLIINKLKFIMISTFKNKIKKNAEIFALIILVLITIISTSYYNYSKKKIY